MIFPKPKNLPFVGVLFMAAGMAVFMLKSLLAGPAQYAVVGVGSALYLAGLLGALAGGLWAIHAVGSRAQRLVHGVLAPLISMLVAVCVLVGTWQVIEKYARAPAPPPPGVAGP
jgi:hypothetical protein